MPNTPLLGITQVSTSQSSKEVTINDAILALENATNAKKDISFASATTYTLTATELTRNFILIAKSATAASTLNVPNTVNGTNTTRLFVVRNDSGQALTVKFTTGAGSTVAIPNGQTRLLAALDGVNIIVAAEPQSAINFLALEDTPGTFVGMAGKFLSANAEGTALEFVDAAVFPDYAENGGKVLAVKADLSGVEWVEMSSITSFAALTDTPSSFTGAGGKLAAVKGDETGIEFIDPPEAEAVEFIEAQQWRVRIVTPGTETQVGFGEVEFLNSNGFDMTGSGFPSAASSDEGKEPEFAFDDNLSVGAGWLSDPEFLGENWIAYNFGTPVTIRSVRLTPITGFPTFTPTRVAFDYWNGVEWIEAGDRVTAEWVEATPQTFKIAGLALQSVADAPVDGKTYARKNGAWVEAPALVTMIAATASNLLASQANGFLRFNATTAKTLTVQPEATEPMPANGEWHIRNAGLSDLTLVEGSGVVINPPATGTLIIPTNGTVTLKRVSANVYDLFGQTTVA